MPKHAREENQQLRRLLLLLVNTETLCNAGWRGENPLDGSINTAHSEVVLLCTRPRVAPIYRATCQYCWLSMLRGVISQHTYRPVIKVEERHGVSAHQRQPGTSLHCARACTSANWFSKAGTCPRHKTADASVNRTVKSAYCTNLLSHQISIEHL